MPDVKQRMLQLGFIQQLHTWHWKVLYWWDIFFRNSEENFIMWGTEHKTTAGVKHLRISAPVWGICVCEKSTNCSVTAPKVSSVSLTTNIDGECHLVCCCLLHYLSLVAPWSSSHWQTVSTSGVHLNTDGTLSIYLMSIIRNWNLSSKFMQNLSVWQKRNMQLVTNVTTTESLKQVKPNLVACM